MQSALTLKPAKTYANDGSYESVEGMLIKQATVFYGRVLGLGLPMEFEDVLQEVKLAYVKAREKWNPEKAKFTTYCFVAVRNEFNRRIERMVNDRVHLGMNSIDALASDADTADDVGDGYERYLSTESEDLSPEDRIERRQEVADRLRSLTPHSRSVVMALLQNEQNTGEPTITLTKIAIQLGLNREQIEAVQQELHDRFGVSVSMLDMRRHKKAA